MKKPKLDYRNGYNETNSICVVWSINDIKSLKGTFDHRNIDLTDKECMQILESLKEKYDSSEGITWEDVCLEHDIYLEERRK